MSIHPACNAEDDARRTALIVANAQSDAELPGYEEQRHAYQEGQRQRFLQEHYQRMDLSDPIDMHARDAEEIDQTEQDLIEALPEGEMPEYIQEEDEEEDPFYFVQPQQQPHGNIYLSASIGDIDRVR